VIECEPTFIAFSNAWGISCRHGLFIGHTKARVEEQWDYWHASVVEVPKVVLM